MQRIPFLVLRDGPGKTVNGVLVASLAARNPAIGGMNVAQGEVIIGLG